MTGVGPRFSSLSFLFLFLVACSAPQALSSAVYEEALVEPPGAYNLLHHSDNGTSQVSYDLDEAYPATSFLEYLNQNLTELGWTPMKESWLNPGSPSSHVSGWSHFQDATVTPNARVDQWMAEWVSAEGAILSYVLQYSSPLSGELTRDTLRVSGTVLSAEQAKAFQDQLAGAVGQVSQLQQVDEQSGLQEQPRASVETVDPASRGRLVLRLLDETAPTPEPEEIVSSSYDEQVAPLELDVVDASVESDPTLGVMLRVVFSDASASLLEEFTSRHLNRSAAIVVDDEAVATVFIATPLPETVYIHGAFTTDSAEQVINRMME